jgi:poly-gamma-glutamate capsule biosynthesis protein CapA/YwtB (metallophosphatase superfamily)
VTPKGVHRRPGGPQSRLLLAVLVLVLVVVAGVSARFFTDRNTSNSAEGKLAPSPRAGARVPSSSPSFSPSSTSSASPTPLQRGKLVIHGTGDVNVDPGYIPNFRAHGYAWAWTGLNGLFKRDDLTVINLECAISKLGRPVPKEFNFRCDPAALPSMRKAGVEVANQGNNHAYDYGPTAVVDGRKNLLKNDIAPVGAGKDAKEALSPALFEVEGWKIAVVGFDKVVDPWPTAVAGTGKPGTAAGHDEDAMVAAVRTADKQADIVIVAIHWGVELDQRPRGADVQLGHRLIDAGADMIFGGHSHRLQPMEDFKGRPIFYSLGNFVWPRHSTAGATTAVAEVTVSSKGNFKGRLIPAFIEASGHPVLR